MNLLVLQLLSRSSALQTSNTRIARSYVSRTHYASSFQSQPYYASLITRRDLSNDEESYNEGDGYWTVLNNWEAAREEEHWSDIAQEEADESQYDNSAAQGEAMSLYLRALNKELDSGDAWYDHNSALGQKNSDDDTCSTEAIYDDFSCYHQSVYGQSMQDAVSEVTDASYEYQSILEETDHHHMMCLEEEMENHDLVAHQTEVNEISAEEPWDIFSQLDKTKYFGKVAKIAIASAIQPILFQPGLSSAADAVPTGAATGAAAKTASASTTAGSAGATKTASTPPVAKVASTVSAPAKTTSASIAAGSAGATKTASTPPAAEVASTASASVKTASVPAAKVATATPAAATKAASGAVKASAGTKVAASSGGAVLTGTAVTKTATAAKTISTGAVVTKAAPVVKAGVVATKVGAASTATKAALGTAAAVGVAAAAASSSVDTSNIMFNVYMTLSSMLSGLMKMFASIPVNPSTFVAAIAISVMAFVYRKVERQEWRNFDDVSNWTLFVFDSSITCSSHITISLT
jgi:hypothetical protein